MPRAIAIALFARLTLALESPGPNKTTTLHSNMVSFKGVRNVSWSETLHAVTGGQPYVGASTKGSSLNVTAGREGSPFTALTFRKGLNDTNILGLNPYMDRSPRELNFVSFGTLTVELNSGVTKVCENMRLGQGHTFLENNWWLGHSECDGGEHNMLQCKVCELSFAISIWHTSAFQVGRLPGYGDPKEACLGGEQPVQVQGVPGQLCSPRCEASGTCPTNLPEEIEIQAKPQCALQTAHGEKSCALICNPDAKKRGDTYECDAGATCQRITDTDHGICTYANNASHAEIVNFVPFKLQEV